MKHRVIDNTRYLVKKYTAHVSTDTLPPHERAEKEKIVLEMVKVLQVDEGKLKKEGLACDRVE